MQLNTEFHQKSRCRFAFNKRQVDLVNETDQAEHEAEKTDAILLLIRIRMKLRVTLQLMMVRS